MWFQFHEGPIKTSIEGAATEEAAPFQFHEGPIKTLIVRIISASVLSFNSMKVRLKPRAF